MGKRGKIVLNVISVVVTSVLVVIAGWVAIGSRDIPAPDVSDLLVGAAEIPDEDNAFTYFTKASEVFEWSDDSRVISIVLDQAWDDAIVTDLLSRNAESLALLERGLACPAYQPYGASLLQRPKPSFLWPGDMSWLMVLKAMQEQRAGRPDLAWRACLDQCRFGSLITAHPRATVECTSGMIALGRGFDEAQRLLRESSRGEAELAILLGQLNRIGPLNQGMVRAIQMEFRYITEAIRDREMDISQNGRCARYLFQPNRTKDACAQLCRAMIANATSPSAHARLPDVKPVRVDGIHRYTLFMGRNSAGKLLAKLFFSPDQMRSDFYIARAIQSRLDGLRLVVACRLYEIRHGRLPETLDALVPESLSEVPRDPFDGKAFRYLSEKGVVYSVGKDLKDSSATATSLSTVYPSRPIRSNGDDLVYAIHDKAKE